MGSEWFVVELIQTIRLSELQTTNYKLLTKMAKPFLSVIIPAYNESERLPATLVDVDKHLSKAEFTYEIIVADDGSRDGTPDIVERMGKTIKHLRVLRFGKNRGKGAVTRDGMLQAEGEYRLFMDADNSTSVDQFSNMLPFFLGQNGESGYQVVFGSRGLKESRLEPPQPLYRQIPGRIGNLIIQVLLLPGIRDTQCGFKAFTAEAAEKVFRPMKIRRWGFDIEALALAKRAGYKMKEMPVIWKNDLRSTVKISAYLQVLLETVKIRLWLWTGAYEANAKIKDQNGE